MGKQLKLTDIGKQSPEGRAKSPSKEQRIKELQKEVEYHQHLYYNSQSEISDAEFDKLWDELRRLDPNNEVLSRVGADFDPSLEKIPHIIR